MLRPLETGQGILPNLVQSYQLDLYTPGQIFDHFLDLANQLGCDKVATGHYAKIVNNILNKNGKFVALFFPTERKEEELEKGPPFYVDLDETLLMFKNNFNIIKILFYFLVVRFALYYF